MLKLWFVWFVLIFIQSIRSYGIKPDLYYKNMLAIGPCIAGKCPEAFFCENLTCRPDMKKMLRVGPCIDNKCPENHSCHENECIRPPDRKIEGSTAIGPCVNELCPDKHICVTEECYPTEMVKFPVFY